MYVKRKEIMPKKYLYVVAFLSFCLVNSVQAMHRHMPIDPYYKSQDPGLKMSKKDMLFKCPDSIYTQGPKDLKTMTPEGRASSIYDICPACLERAKMEKEEMEQMDKTQNKSLIHKPRIGVSESKKRDMHALDMNIVAWKDFCPEVMVR